MTWFVVALVGGALALILYAAYEAFVLVDEIMADGDGGLE